MDEHEAEVRHGGAAKPPKKTLSRYFIKTKEAKEAKEPEAPPEAPPKAHTNVFCSAYQRLRCTKKMKNPIGLHGVNFMEAPERSSSAARGTLHCDAFFSGLGSSDVQF